MRRVRVCVQCPICDTKHVVNTKPDTNNNMGAKCDFCSMHPNYRVLNGPHQTHATVYRPEPGHMTEKK